LFPAERWRPHRVSPPSPSQSVELRSPQNRPGNPRGVPSLAFAVRVSGEERVPGSGMWLERGMPRKEGGGEISSAFMSFNQIPYALTSAGAVFLSEAHFFLSASFRADVAKGIFPQQAESVPERPHIPFNPAGKRRGSAGLGGRVVAAKFLRQIPSTPVSPVIATCVLPNPANPQAIVRCRRSGQPTANPFRYPWSEGFSAFTRVTGITFTGISPRPLRPQVSEPL